jgi:hypothetical protein
MARRAHAFAVGLFCGLTLVTWATVAHAHPASLGLDDVEHNAHHLLDAMAVLPSYVRVLAPTTGQATPRTLVAVGVVTTARPEPGGTASARLCRALTRLTGTTGYAARPATTSNPGIAVRVVELRLEPGEALLQRIERSRVTLLFVSDDVPPATRAAVVEASRQLQILTVSTSTAMVDLGIVVCVHPPGAGDAAPLYLRRFNAFRTGLELDPALLDSAVVPDADEFRAWVRSRFGVAGPPWARP